jgi:hypothetical protein
MHSPALFPLASSPPATRAARRALADLLVAVSQALGRLALALAERPASQVAALAPHQVEFHADAGAPEGALYVDGQLVALLPGVSRL